MLNSSLGTFSDSILNNFNQSLRLPIDERFQELSKILDKYSSKELQSIFPAIIDHVFKLNLRMVNDSKPYEFHILYSFLNPFGNIFNLIYKLIIDCQATFDFPISSLPEMIQNDLKNGKASRFYSNLINFNFQSQEITCLKLNAFDYYMFHFAQYLTQTSKEQFVMIKHFENTIYYALLRDYISHFLPIDPNYTITPYVNYIGSKNVMMTMMRSACNKSQRRQSPLIKLSAIQTSTYDLNNSTMTQDTCSPNDTWRSETVLQVFLDFWINYENYHCNKTISNWFNKFPLPTNEHVIVVRIFIKHLHAFASSSESNFKTPLYDLKKQVIFMVQNRMYFFLNQLFHHWPLDNSFRSVLELWLSYIQPWRYFEGNGKNYRFDDSDLNQTDFDSCKYTEFMVENLLTYTALFNELIPRLLRMDLSSPSKASMVYRVAKVFNQKSLIKSLNKIESIFSDTIINSLNSEFQGWMVTVRQRILELEGPNYVYKPIFSEETKKKIVQLVKYIKNCNKISQSIITKINTNKNKSFGLLETIKSSFFDYTDQDEQFLTSEHEKTPLYLNCALEYLSNIFEINKDDIEADESVINNNTMFLQSTSDDGYEPVYYKPHLKTLKYDGNPDLLPAGSNEFEPILKITNQLATFINNQFVDKISNLYNRTDFFGRMSRQLLSPPQSYYAYEKNENGASVRRKRFLHPRLSLRFFANQFLVYCIVFLMICSFLSIQFPVKLALFLLCLKVFIIITKAFFTRICL